MSARTLTAACALAAVVAFGVPAAADVFDPVISSNEPRPFPRDAENEPALALDRANHSSSPLLVAGGNDYHDQQVCTSSSDCSFKPGVGISGLYFSDDGATWKIASYPGLASSGTTTGPGTITTLPNFNSKRWSFGDPGLAAGPRPRTSGSPAFAWSNGTRVYYVTLAAAASAPKRVITVSRADPTAPARVVQPAWTAPKIVSSVKSWADKPAIWADDAAMATAGVRNARFGAVYVCWTSYGNEADTESAAPRGRIVFRQSMDGTAGWSAPITVSKGSGAQGCTIRTDSTGRIYVFWEERRLAVTEATLAAATQGTPCSKLFRSLILMSRSKNGVAFEPPKVVAKVREAGAFDPRQGRCTVDGVAGARTNSWPAVSIASGAPNGPGPNTIAVAWSQGMPAENVFVRISHDLGNTWSAPLPVSRARPAFPAVALSPDGLFLYVVYNAFLQGWQSSTAVPRKMQGVVRVTRLADLEQAPANAPWGEARGAPGDARGSAGFEDEPSREKGPRPGIAAEFLGDYSAIVATQTGAYAAWTDAAAAVYCGAVDEYRKAIIKAGKGTFKSLDESCPEIRTPGAATQRFGNTTLCGARLPPNVAISIDLDVCARDEHPR